MITHEDLRRNKNLMLRSDFWSIPDPKRPADDWGKYNKIAETENEFEVILERYLKEYADIDHNILKAELIAFVEDMMRERNDDFANRHERMRAIQSSQKYVKFLEWLKKKEISRPKKHSNKDIQKVFILCELSGAIPRAQMNDKEYVIHVFEALNKPYIDRVRQDYSFNKNIIARNPNGDDIQSIIDDLPMEVKRTINAYLDSEKKKVR